MIALLPALVLLAHTPEGTVRAFIDGFNARDTAAMARQTVAGEDRHPSFPANYPKLGYVAGRTRIDGDNATLEVHLSTREGGSKIRRSHETVRLRRIEGDWRIVASVAGARLQTPSDSTTIANLALVVANPGLIDQPRIASKQTASLSNVKQIAVAALLYAGEHDDHLPSATNLKASLIPYLRNADVFTAPDAPKGSVGYFLDPRLSGVVVSWISNPAGTAMILQGSPRKTAFPYQGRTAMSYADGHAKVVDAPTVATARKAKLD